MKDDVAKFQLEIFLLFLLQKYCLLIKSQWKSVLRVLREVIRL